MTGEAFFGELKKGFVQNIPIIFARKLINNQSTIFQELKLYCSFEAAVGINGKLWVKANDANKTIIVINAIKKSQFMDI